MLVFVFLCVSGCVFVSVVMCFVVWCCSCALWLCAVDVSLWLCAVDVSLWLCVCDRVFVVVFVVCVVVVCCG